MQIMNTKPYFLFHGNVAIPQTTMKKYIEIKSRKNIITAKHTVLPYNLLMVKVGHTKHGIRIF